MNIPEANDANLPDLLSIKLIGNSIVMERSIYDDHFADLEDLPDPSVINSRMVSYQNEPGLLEKLKDLRIRNYYADVWFPVISHLGIPGQQLLEVSDLKTTLENFTYPCYIRTHKASPKDIHNPPLFTDPETAYFSLTTSERTRFDLSYLLVSSPHRISQEARCFVYHSKLVALSQNFPFGPIDQEEVANFKKGSSRTSLQ